MSFIQVPPDNTGKLVETVNPTTSEHRQVVVLGDPSTVAIAPVTSSAGLAVSLANTSLTVVSASSGAVQVLTSGRYLAQLVSSSDAFIPGTSSGGLGVTILAGAGSGSTEVMLTGSSGAFAPVTSSGGLAVSIVAGTISASTAVSLTSAIAISSGTVDISSGIITLSSAPLVVVASSSPLPPITISSGTVTLSSAIGISSGSIIADTRRGLTLQFATVTVSSGGAKILVTASGSNKIKVTSYVLVASSAVNITWQSSNTALSGQMFLSSNSGIAISGDMNAWVLETSAAGDLRLATDVTSYLTGHLAFFYEV